MLLDSVKATNGQGTVLNLPLDDPSTGFIVKKIEGLDPVKANLVSSSFANQDGEQYHSSRRETRNIKLTLGLVPDYAAYDVRYLRDQLYQFFMPKTVTTLGFHMFDKFAPSVYIAQLDLEIEAHIETFDCDMFVEEPEAIISVMCYNPDFVDPNGVTIDGMSVSDTTETLHQYKGTVDSGVVFTLMPDRDIAEFAIYHRTPNQKLNTINFSAPLLAGDVLTISSIPGSKHVTLKRAGVETSLLYGVTPQSPWLTLQPGDNNLRIYATGAAIPYSIDYTTKYGGL